MSWASKIKEFLLPIVLLLFALIVSVGLNYNAQEDETQATIDQLANRVIVSGHRQKALSNKLQAKVDALEASMARGLQEIRYYRDQMDYVIKTCPGRERPPELPWEPEFLNE